MAADDLEQEQPMQCLTTAILVSQNANYGHARSADIQSWYLADTGVSHWFTSVTLRKKWVGLVSHSYFCPLDGICVWLCRNWSASRKYSYRNTVTTGSSRLFLQGTTESQNTLEKGFLVLASPIDISIFYHILYSSRRYLCLLFLFGVRLDIWKKNTVAKKKMYLVLKSVFCERDE